MRPTLTTLAIWILAIATSLLIWQIGRFPFLDEAAFKGIGKNWAESGKYVCPELSGFVRSSEDPVVLLHVPLYAYLFGFFVRWVGFGWTQTVLFDAVIHGSLVVATYHLGRQFTKWSEREWQVPLPAWPSILAAVAIVPLEQAGRPDELAMVFGYLGLLLLLREEHSRGRTAASGGLFGLCAATSLGAAVALGFFAFFLVFTQRRPLAGRLADGVLWQCTALLVLALLLAPILLTSPHALTQFLDHVEVVRRGKSFLEFTVSGWTHARHRILPVAGLFLVAVLAWPLRGKYRWFLSTWLGLFLGAAFIVFFLPGEFLYFWFFTPWMWAAAAVTIALLWRLKFRGLAWTSAASLGFFALPVFIWAAVQWLCVLTLPVAQRADYNARLIARLIPPGSTVLTDYYWPFLPGRYRVYSPTFSMIGNPEEIDYILLSPIGGGGVGKYQWMRTAYERLAAEKFEVAYNNLPDKPLTIAGRPLTKTTWGFGFILFARKPPSPP